jgi:predicted DNA binding CopG/RHH family protein
MSGRDASPLATKKFPEFKTDAEAEAFVEYADLSEYDFSDRMAARFEFRRNEKSVSLRLPEELVEAARNRAQREGMPFQRFIRMAIERALQQPLK